MSEQAGCPEFPKIRNLWERVSEKGPDAGKLIEGALTEPWMGVPKRWAITEKIDGTNVRVSLECSTADPSDPESLAVRFYGRTGNAQMPTFLVDHLQNTFGLPKLLALCRGKPEEPYYPTTLYGEGYGARIQKGGGDYRSDVSFRLIDVLIGRTWLGINNVKDVAAQIEIRTVPLLFGPPDGLTIPEAVAFVRDGFPSVVVSDEGAGNGKLAEGIVASVDPPLFDSRGKRLRFKLKTKDFTRGLVEMMEASHD